MSLEEWQYFHLWRILGAPSCQTEQPGEIQRMEHRTEQELDSGVCCRCYKRACLITYVRLLSMWIQSGLSPVQVDFQRPVVISQVATQGAREMFYSQYVVEYTISYSTDRRKWIFYKGDSRSFRKVGEVWSQCNQLQTKREVCDHLFTSLCLSLTRYSLGTRMPMR